jgi:hypothetical protein
MRSLNLDIFNFQNGSTVTNRSSLTSIKAELQVSIVSSIYGGAVMPKIEFRGQTYNDEFEMPYDVHQAYIREKEQRAEKNKRSSAASAMDKSSAKSLTDIVDMSPEVKAIYERALGKVEDKLPASRQTKNLPKTEDIYRQSAPDDMKHLPSDESIYRPSEPLIDPAKSVIEPESAFGVNRFISSIIWALILVAVVYLIMQLLP